MLIRPPPPHPHTPWPAPNHKGWLGASMGRSGSDCSDKPPAKRRSARAAAKKGQKGGVCQAEQAVA